MLNDSTPQSFRDLPKNELHAHLNGSISKDTALQLSQRTFSHDFHPRLCEDVERQYEQNTTHLVLADFFPLFTLIYQLTDDVESVTIATEKVIEDFAKDNVVYLELRSTPRATAGMSRKDYVEAMTQGIKKCQHLNIIVRIILTLDRRGKREDWAYSSSSHHLLVELFYKSPIPS
ncbi:hypothetical protein SeMB42_g07946 [Synchytrium endobioticum]|uniref:Adenosine deaminase domain-containing protein n=1 Tax=Synchytrium endobioticum TaxID=286115 RepID=A0A507CDK3_9FUNG|nr:hypothetical protein SeMB42_g07946 [Synchytrium endobioticum]TPX39137.1 hypothetical protein SeLEV6574_g07414 [Synchytrium endobioticum]